MFMNRVDHLLAYMLINPNENASRENSLFSAHHQAPIEMSWTLRKCINCKTIFIRTRTNERKQFIGQW